MIAVAVAVGSPYTVPFWGTVLCNVLLADDVCMCPATLESGWFRGKVDVDG